ncbi:hypothetical protein QT979_11250 [Microcoleus sp. w2-18bC1]|uniref:hypothetical protein n=1 Tax=unclassified Microcoleus TaxID=2642155 RepID=UPI002FD1995D
MSVDDVSHPALGVAGMGAIDIPKQRLPMMYYSLRGCTIVNKPFRNWQDARSTRKSTLCGTGILPVLENGARCTIYLGSIRMNLVGMTS